MQRLLSKRRRISQIEVWLVFCTCATLLNSLFGSTSHRMQDRIMQAPVHNMLLCQSERLVFRGREGFISDGVYMKRAALKVIVLTVRSKLTQMLLGTA